MALTDAVLFSAPFALSFLGWAAVSWIIVGHPFEQFSSVYGTSSQLQVLNAGKAGRTHYIHVQAALAVILAFAPFIPLAAWLRSAGPGTTAIPGSLPSCRCRGRLAVRGRGLSPGAINIAERYFIYAIPLMVLLVA